MECDIDRMTAAQEELIREASPELARIAASMGYSSCGAAFRPFARPRPVWRRVPAGDGWRFEVMIPDCLDGMTPGMVAGLCGCLMRRAACGGPLRLPEDVRAHLADPAFAPSHREVLVSRDPRLLPADAGMLEALEGMGDVGDVLFVRRADRMPSHADRLLRVASVAAGIQGDALEAEMRRLARACMSGWGSGSAGRCA